MARWNLRRAARLAESDRGLAAEAAEWRALATALVDGYDPETGLYEQFRGFWGLEPLIIAELIPDRPVSADDVLGRSRVQGAQVIKQPDVLMLHHLVPEETVPGSLLANLDYYEPRTSHGSSLSPGIHAALLARAGLLEEAVNLVRLTSRLDLDDISGNTSGGLHLAAMGSLWQAIVFGFAGARMAGSRLRLDPKVPASWDVLEVPLRVRDAVVRVRADPEHAVVDADHPTTVDVAGAGPVAVGRRPLRLRSTVRGWRVTR
jgi:trehalose/maltose hydrolase-like predicted phosphorylase